MKVKHSSNITAIFVLSLLFFSWHDPKGPGVGATLTYSPILSPTSTPMYFPVINGPNPSINLVCAKGISLDNIKIPNVTITKIDIKNAVTLSERFYQQYGKFVGASDEQVKAAHNLAIAKMDNAIVSGGIQKGCKVTARMTVGAVEKLLKSKIKIDGKLAKIANGIPGTVAKTLAKQTVQEWTTEKCIITSRFIGKNIIEITVDTYFGLQNAIDEAKYWMAYMNSIEGMIWISNHLK
jgi:hypothetical protein